MKEVYILEHVIEKNDEDEIKFIGVFSSIIYAKNAINQLIKKSGFNNFPAHCFRISKEQLDEYGWKEGFISWKNAIENDTPNEDAGNDID